MQRHSFVKAWVCAMGITAIAGCDTQDAEQTISTVESPSEELSGSAILDDAIAPIGQTELTIGASPGVLELGWQALPAGHEVHIDQYNPVTGESLRIASRIDHSINRWTLPSRTPSRLWDDELFGLEICSDHGCVKAPRQKIAPLAQDSLSVVSPALALANEAFAEHTTVSADASVIVATHPIAGALSIYLQLEQAVGEAGYVKSWVETQRLLLDRPQHMIADLASSANGDILAVLLTGKDPQTHAEILTVRRLGEAWFVTGSTRIDPSNLEESAGEITLSSDGRMLLFVRQNGLSVFAQSEEDWFEHSVINRSGSRVFAASTNADFNRLFWIEQTADDNNLTLHYYAENGLASDPSMSPRSEWLPISTTTLLDAESRSDARVISDPQGNRVFVASWERTGTEQSVATVDEFNLQQEQLIIGSSIRVPSVAGEQASLRFSANAELNHVALGWQDSRANTAVLHTFRRATDAAPWQTALRLPELMPSLTRHAFADQSLFSADGATLIVGTRTNPIDPRAPRELMIFH